MTSLPTTTTDRPAGVLLIEALSNGDLDAVRGLLAPDIHLRNLQPDQTHEADDLETALAMLAAGFVNEAMRHLGVTTTGRIGTRDLVAYRGQWVTPDGSKKVFEQHAYYDTDPEGRISWMHVVCSGNHPFTRS